MNKEDMKSILEKIANQLAPEEKINLWPSIESKLLLDHEYGNKEITIRKKIFSVNSKSPLQQGLVLAIILITLFSTVLFFTTPQGKVIGQNLVQFFKRSETNQLALPIHTLTTVVSESTETTPLSSSFEETKKSAVIVTSPDPKNILDAKNQIDEIQELVEYNLEVPDWIPVNLIFSGASIEEGDGNQIVRIFYSINDSDQDYYTNGLVLRQQLIPITGYCELCTIVGADAFIQEVSISGSYGEYVEGVWKYTEKGIVWEPDPHLKRLRWQNEGMAFELMFMGPPEMLLVDDLVKIAEIIN